MQSYEKMSEMQNEKQAFYFHFRVPSKFGEAKVTKSREKNKRFFSFFMLQGSKLYEKQKSQHS